METEDISETSVLSSALRLLMAQGNFSSSTHIFFFVPRPFIFSKMGSTFGTPAIILPIYQPRMTDNYER
jgi:hypothetical protein